MLDKRTGSRRFSKALYEWHVRGELEKEHREPETEV